MNFNNPEDIDSSSSYSGSSPASSDSTSEEADEDNGEDTAMSLDVGDVTGQSLVSIGSAESTSSSSRLDEALRQAVVQADAQDTQQGMFIDNSGGAVEVANEEIANAFKPWIHRNKRDTIGLKKISSIQDQENINPFSPQFRAHIDGPLTEKAKDSLEEETQDMSMDMTHVMGGIVRQQHMEQENETENSQIQQKSLKRRRASTIVDFSSNATSAGSPAKRQASRRSSIRRRRSSAEDSSLEDETMDLTMAIGGIQQISRDSESVDTFLGEETMDFTIVQGSILSGPTPEIDDELNADEDLSMELTATLEKTIKVNSLTTMPKSPAKKTRSPRKSIAPPRTPERPSRATTKQAKTPTPQKLPRKSPRKSTTSATLIREEKGDSEVPQPSLTSDTENNTPSLVGSETLGSAFATEIPTNYIPTILVAATPPQQKEHEAEEPFAGSPLKPVATKTTSLAESIKLLSTPRKQTSVSPVKRGGAPGTPKVSATPKKAATPKKTPTPRRTATPRRRGRVGFAEEDEEEHDKNNPIEEIEDKEDHEEVERIQLQDFLNMTNIRFMDLTTTKRRHTGHPGAEGKFAPEYDEEDNSPPSLESNVAAAVCTVPMLTMYQHSCHEMKNYIAGGRDDLRTLEADVYDSQPTLFREYMSAPPDERAIMDNQFKNMKTNARLQSKAGWHAWRSQLLTDLKSGLLQSAADFEVDEVLLSQQEGILNATLPDLVSYSEELESRCKQLQERADELSSSDHDELEAARERLVASDAEIEDKKQLLAELQRELAAKETHIEAVMERKAECVEEIKEAERVREEYRGWSAGEVSVLKGMFLPSRS